MLTFWAKVIQGKIELLEPANLPEGVDVLVTIFPSPGTASQPETHLKSKDQISNQSLADVWQDVEADGIWDTASGESGQPFLPSSDSSSLLR